MRYLEYAYPGMGYAEICDQFLMGDDLLVAPVVEKGAGRRRVVIPPGQWRGDDGKEFNGPATVEVAAPLDRLPHFVRLSTDCK
jgi:alpha-glucosidase (family GH31 glycosyl hydrolase)